MLPSHCRHYACVIPGAERQLVVLRSNLTKDRNDHRVVYAGYLVYHLRYLAVAECAGKYARQVVDFSNRGKSVSELHVR